LVTAAPRAPGYTPDCGDLVWLDFDPQACREQAGRRPALVLSRSEYNARSSFILCCPVTNQAKGWPFEVPIAVASGRATGVALSDQVRSVDPRARNAEKFASVTQECLSAVVAKVKLMLPLR
jgi:mRNA interferase MazF